MGAWRESNPERTSSACLSLRSVAAGQFVGESIEIFPTNPQEAAEPPGRKTVLANRGVEIPERYLEHPGRLVRAELIVPLVGVPALARVLGVRCGEAVAALI